MLGYLCLTWKKSLVQASAQEKLLKICSSWSGYLCNAAKSSKTTCYLWSDCHLSEGMDLPCSCQYFCKNSLCICGGFAFSLFLASSPFSLADQILGNAISVPMVFQKMHWSSSTCILFLQDVQSWKITHTCGLKIKELCVNLEFEFHSVFDILFLPALGWKCRISNILKKQMPWKYLPLKATV